MDVERQHGGGGGEGARFTFGEMKDRLKEKTKHPTASGTLIIFLILNIIMLIVGFVKKNECPIQQMIPVYLIVAGIVGIISKLLPFINRKLNSNVINYVIYALYVFEFVWMILGSYWVYTTPRQFDKRMIYCSRTAYYLAFWLITVNWILLGVTIILACCAMVIAHYRR